MDGLEFNNKDLEVYRKQLEETNRIIETNTNSFKSFLSAQKESLKLSKLINYSENQLNIQKKRLIDNQKTINELTKKLEDKEKNLIDLSNQEEAIIQEKLKNLKSEQDYLKNQTTYHHNLILSYKKEDDLIKSSLNSWKAISNVVRNEVTDSFKKGWKSLLEQDKTIRKTQLSMGILSDQSLAFSQNIYKASTRTGMLGVNAKELAKIQGEYSNELGRSVMLSEEGLMAMSEMAKGTTLGSEGAALLAGQMDNFGISVSNSKDIMQETVNLAHTMGVNANKVTKNMLNNLKLAQRFHFKGGVAGISEMANRAAKFKLDMESVAGFADKLFTPEGAIEAAAQLQVLGGEWAKLADPFKLMYQARNDIDQLHKSIVEATASTAQFNKNTGEFEISGLELHRLREIAKATGIEMEQLSKSAKEVAKVKFIKTQIGADISEDYYNFISSVANIDKSGKISLNLAYNGNSITKIEQLNNNILETIVKQNETLKKRAIEAQTFDELFGNLKNTFKNTLLPFMKGIEMGLREPLDKFRVWLDNNDIQHRMSEFSEKVGNFAITIGKFVADNPFKSIMAAIGGIGIFEYGKWYMNGLALRKGFNSIGNKIDGGVGNLFGGKSKNNRLSNISNKLKGVKGVGIGAIGGLASLGLSVGRESLSKPDSTAGKMMGIGSSTLGGLSTGAMIGSMFGPISTLIGIALGGVGGLGYGLYNEYSNKSSNSNLEPTKQNDFIMRPGKKAQAFSNEDTIIGFKPNGAIDRYGDNKNSNKENKLSIEFKPLKIEFSPLTIQSGNSKVDIDLKDPLLLREIGSLIQQELRKTIGGGKLNPNPI